MGKVENNSLASVLRIIVRIVPLLYFRRLFRLWILRRLRVLRLLLVLLRLLVLRWLLRILGLLLILRWLTLIRLLLGGLRRIACPLTVRLPRVRRISHIRRGSLPILTGRLVGIIDRLWLPHRNRFFISKREQEKRR